MHIADTIKEQVTTRQACQMYGIPINRSGFARCVAHNDTKPSMKVYNGNRGWYCFACNTGGDVISLVQLAIGVDYKTAIARINDDFDLHLPLNRSLTASEKAAMEQEAQKRKRLIAQKEAEKLEIEVEYWNAFDKCLLYEGNKLRHAPKSIHEEWHPLFVEALQNLPEAKYALSVAEDRRMTYGK